MQKRNTATKQLIQEILHDAASAMSQDMVEHKLHGKADRVTIYRVLNSFCEDGIVHRIVSDEGKAYYALCHRCKEGKHKHEHPHFRCLNCQKVECLPVEVKVKLPTGYRLENFNYWMSGYCSSCN